MSARWRCQRPSRRTCRPRGQTWKRCASLCSCVRGRVFGCMRACDAGAARWRPLRIRVVLCVLCVLVCVEREWCAAFVWA
jgi:hypothetical protein